MPGSRIIFRLSAVLVWLCLLVSSGQVLAQGGAPIQIGQNATGTLSTEVSSAQFTVTTSGSATALIQVLALSPGFAPRFTVLNPAGIEILSISNPTGQASISGNATFNDAGSYTIVIQGENGSTGQFVLSLQPGTPLPEPITLTVDQPVLAMVGTQTPVQIYRFKTTAQGMLNLTVLSQTPNAGPLVTLFDEAAGKTIASSDAGVVGVAYQLPAADRLYRVEVRAAGATGNTTFSICVGACGGGLAVGGATPVPTAAILVPATPVSTPEVGTAACSASSSAGGAANLRGGPGTVYQIRGSLPVGQSIPVMGVWTGGGWYEVNAAGQALWVAASVVSLAGDCSALPAVEAPVNAPLAPTQTPTTSGGGNPGGSQPTDTPEPSDTPQPPLPNLTIINLQISSPSAGVFNAEVTVMNNGTAPLAGDQPFAVLTCVDGFDNCNEIDGMMIPLQPGDVTSFTVEVPSFTPGGNHTVNVTVDGRSEIGELNESDNSAFASFNT